MSTRRLYVLSCTLLFMVFATAMFVILLLAGTASKGDIGVELVKAMYDFETPDELVDNQQIVKEMLAPEEWEELKLDNTLRTVNAYYKFGYDLSRVTIIDSAPGYVVYKIYNPSVSEDTRWLFFYNLDGQGLVDDVREYQLIADGGSVPVDGF